MGGTIGGRNILQREKITKNPFMREAIKEAKRRGGNHSSPKKPFRHLKVRG